MPPVDVSAAVAVTDAAAAAAADTPPIPNASSCAYRTVPSSTSSTSALSSVNRSARTTARCARTPEDGADVDRQRSAVEGQHRRPGHADEVHGEALRPPERAGEQAEDGRDRQRLRGQVAHPRVPPNEIDRELLVGREAPAAAKVHGPGVVVEGPEDERELGAD